MGSLNVRLDDELSERLKAQAQRMNLRRSDVVRMILSRSLPPARPSSPQERYDRVKHLLGSLDSGVDDLGTNHETHLGEMLAADDKNASGHGAAGGDAGPAGPAS